MGIRLKIKVSDPELGLLLRGNESNRSLRGRCAGICWCRQAKGRYLTQMAKSELRKCQMFLTQVHVSGNLLNNVKSIWETNFFDALQSKAVFRFCSERGINRTVKPWKYSEWRPRPWSVAGTFPLNRTTGQRVWHRKGGENYRQWHREERPSLWPNWGMSFLETLL